VIQADGGTRTASITGACIALFDALTYMRKNHDIKTLPMKDFVAATSVGVVNGQVLLDLNYHEDSKAQVDMNLVMTGSGKFVEIQGTAEEDPFSEEEMQQMVASAKTGIQELIKIQRSYLGETLMDKFL
jgi:ribonuclease PH